MNKLSGATQSVIFQFTHYNKLHERARAYRWQLNDHGRKMGRFNSEHVKRFVHGVWASGLTPDGYSLLGVNWQAVSKALNSL